MKTDINDNKELALIERDHSITENKKSIVHKVIPNKEIKKENGNENEKETQSTNNKFFPTLQDRNINDEIEEIINRDPQEELKIIKEKIKKENSKIKEINNKLDNLQSINSQPVKKRNIKLIDDFDSYLNSSKKQNNTLLPPTILASISSQNISKNNSLSLEPTLDVVHQKMKNLRKIKLEKIDKKKEVDELIDNIVKKRHNSISRISNNELRLLSLEEDEQKEKEEKQKKFEKKLQLFRERELEREKERKKIIDKINNISTQQINNKYIPKKNYITYEEKEEQRKMKQEALYKLEIEKRKLRYKPISSEELINFSNEVRKNEKILKTELDKKKKQMEELWKERKNLLPKFHSKFMNLNIDMDNEAKNEKKSLQEEKIKNKELGVYFGKEIMKTYQPKIVNDKLKTEREQRINDLKGINRLGNIKELKNKMKQKTNRIVQSQPKQFNKNNIFVVEETVAEQQAKKLTGKPLDYLLELRKEKSKIDLDKLIQSNSAKKMKKWKEMLDKEGNNIYDNVEKIKIQAAIMDDKAKNIKEILKHGGNKSPERDELNHEASNLYMNSIEAKLQILNKILNTNN